MATEKELTDFPNAPTSNPTVKESGVDKSTWSTVRESVTDFVEDVKERVPRDTVRKVSDAAGQAKEYVEQRGVEGLVEDVTAVIRRYPVPALLFGVAIGVLLARRQGS